MPRYEVAEDLSEDVKDLSRARQSLIEEIEAMMFYDERADATKEKGLKLVMEHNRDDEKEHAVLLLEWLRRHDKQLDKELKEILFSKKELDKLGD
ncbi:MAG: ferritin family protein [Candidatus Micrarchaeaceae archaeon]